MTDIRCPMCGKTNPVELDNCQFCGARLKPLLASSANNSHPNLGSEDQTPENASRFEEERHGAENLIQPGQVPSEKHSNDPDTSLPSWLRSLREGQDSGEDESTKKSFPSQELPFEPVSTIIPDSPVEHQTDLLSGLARASSDDNEEIPDWLAGLRGASSGTSDQEFEPSSEPVHNATDNLSSSSDEVDWLNRLSSEVFSKTPETERQENQEEQGIPLELKESSQSETTISEHPDDSSFPPVNPVTSDWGSDAYDSTLESKPASSRSDEIRNLMAQLRKKGIDSGSAGPGEEEASHKADLPDWLKNLEPVPENPSVTTGENLPPWLTDLEAKTNPEASGPALVYNSESSPSSKAFEETPAWLSQLQSVSPELEDREIEKEPSEETPEQPKVTQESEPLPDWLAEIRQPPTSSAGIPALIANDQGASSERNDSAFALETPDWLSQLKPEKGDQNDPSGEVAKSTPGDLEISELPSWVQAMRPVESVVDYSRANPPEEFRITEQSGPLAGLQGVLPVGPGLGLLRKPPAYSSILQVSESQQRYATSFIKLISSETQPQVARSERLTSSRLWRWLIAVLLILAVAYPLVTGKSITPTSQLQPPELVDAFTVVNNLSSNAPVLIVFDYDPALSGEMEAAAAPIMDHLLLQAPRLALISTKPTGPALAERLLHDKNASPLVAGHNYLSGQQVLNLGYLAGGPAGVQLFSLSPADAAPFTLDGEPAWGLLPVQGIEKLSDFSAILVLTDNVDGGRVWIEQTGSMTGGTPILMVISAQAEPMILPYYDSGQVKGLVTGLAGGEAYEQILIRSDAQSGHAQRFWNSFSAGALTVELLIVVGALWSAIFGLRLRHNTGDGV